MSPDDGTPETPGPCDRCGGEAVLRDDAGAPVFECRECGNVLGLAGPDAHDEGSVDSTDDTTETGADVSTGAVTATDGSLDQLVGLLRSEGGPKGRISTERLLLGTGDATLVVTAEDGTVTIREEKDA